VKPAIIGDTAKTVLLGLSHRHLFETTKIAKIKHAPQVSDSQIQTPRNPLMTPRTNPGAIPATLALLVATVTCVYSAQTKQTEAQFDAAVQKIDVLITADLQAHKLQVNPPATDDQFLRRVYLDTIGRVPTAAEARAFTDDTSAGKRKTLIDKLLISDGYRSHMFNWLADMLRVKDEYARVGQTYTFHTWIKDQLKANRPWDKMVSDMVTATGRLGENGATGYLLRDASMPLDSLSNTLTLFLGANVACAQCHDHPFADWTQRDFYEMTAFFGTTRFERDDPRKPAKSMGDKEFSKANLVTLLRPNMARVVPEKGRWLKYPEDYAYDDAKPGERVTPTFIKWSDTDSKTVTVKTGAPDSLRKQFADWMTSKDNPRFAAAIANRLWKKNFGLAVQEPVADLDRRSAATNPKLLAYLSDLMKAVDFDTRRFQRILFNTQTYQRQASVTPPADVTFRFSGPLLRRMTAEQAWDSAVVMIRGEKVDHFQTNHADKMKRLLLPANIPLDRKGLVKHKKEVFAFARTLNAKKDTKNRRVNAEGKTKGGRGLFFRVNKLNGNAAWNRASELPQPMKPEHFLRIAGQSARSVPDDGSTEGGITESLAFMNGPVTERVMARTSQLMQKVALEKATAQKADLLYMSILSRKPTPKELKRASEALEGKMKPADLAWALLNSREFIFIQ
jgi:hypothetical protein